MGLKSNIRGVSVYRSGSQLTRVRLQAVQAARRVEQRARVHGASQLLVARDAHYVQYLVRLRGSNIMQK